MVDAKFRSFTDSRGLFLIRVIVGVVFVYHGSQTVFGAGRFSLEATFGKKKPVD